MAKSFASPVKKGELKVVDALGKTALIQKVEEGSVSAQIDVSKLNSGVYFVMLESEKLRSRPVKLVVQ